MQDVLYGCELFAGLDKNDLTTIERLAEHQPLPQGDYLFRLGEQADRIYVVLEGEIETCQPLTFEGRLTDVAVERMGPGSALGWSAFVDPNRFTLSARAARPCKLAVFRRAELERLFEANPRLGYTFIENVVGLVGRRLFSMQALWTRELQRAVNKGRLEKPADASAR